MFNSAIYPFIITKSKRNGSRNAQLSKASINGENYTLRTFGLKIKLKDQVPYIREKFGRLTNVRRSVPGIFLSQPSFQCFPLQKGTGFVYF